MIEIKDKSKCSGCHACYNICPKNAITMKTDEKGFKYPVIDKEKCIKCGLCTKVCPIIKNKEIKITPKAYACYNKNEEIRMKSSSGGIFTLLATEIIKRGGIVFGATFKENFSVEHTFVENEEDLEKFRGSKYTQSIIGNTYKKVKEELSKDRYVLFTGTPCQTEGLLAYLQKDYKKLYTQDIICHGVPSPKVWRNYKEYMQKNNGKILECSNRTKKQGWKNWSVYFKFKNNSEYVMRHNKDIYMQAFLRNTSLRDSCYNCSFKKLNRLSDITLADFWGIEHIKPKMDDDKGTSLVIVNSKKGQELFNSIKENTVYEETNLENAIKFNKSMIQSVKMDKNREKFFENLEKMDFDKLVKKYTYTPNIVKRVVNKSKNLLKKLSKKIKQ